MADATLMAEAMKIHRHRSSVVQFKSETLGEIYLEVSRTRRIQHSTHYKPSQNGVLRERRGARAHHARVRARGVPLGESVPPTISLPPSPLVIIFIVFSRNRKVF
jgi:hypothetical protein